MKNETVEGISREYTEKGITESDVHFLRTLANDSVSALKRYARRRLLGEPLEYIKGETEFYGRAFLVDRRVYIPTRETESLVKCVLEDIKTHRASSVLDVGTGAGTIAITLALEAPETQVAACDIDPAALDVARQNAKRHSARIQLCESFYVDDVPREPTHIIADLPYGNQHHLLGSNTLENLKHMPAIAVFPPDNSLQAYEELIMSVKKKGWSPKIFMETGPIGKEEIQRIIPLGAAWKYHQVEEGYSITEIILNA